MFSYLRILLFAGLTILISSCTGHSRDKEVIRLMSVQLDKSSKDINFHTTAVLRSLEEKKNDPITKEKASVWFPKADSISKISTLLYIYLEQLKKKGQLNSDEATEFASKLKEYSGRLLGMNERIKQEFENNQFLASCAKDSLTFKNRNTQSGYLRTLNEEALNAMLTHIQNNIRIIENKTIHFCNEQSTSHWHHDDFYSALIGLNTNQVNPGGKIEITAGIGVFSTLNNPAITINKKIVPLNESGYSLHNITAPSKPGKYTIPVKIIFISHITGKEEWIERNVEYTVTTPCN